MTSCTFESITEIYWNCCTACVVVNAKAAEHKKIYKKTTKSAAMLRMARLDSICLFFLYVCMHRLYGWDYSKVHVAAEQALSDSNFTAYFMIFYYYEFSTFDAK